MVSDPLALMLLCGATLGAAAMIEPPSARVTRENLVFTPGETAAWGTRYFCFRVPAAVRRPEGTLLIFAQGSIGACHDQAPKDIVMRTSVDSGASWSPLVLVAGPEDRSVSNVTYRNPYPVVDKSGRLLLQYVDTTHARRGSGRAVTWQQVSTDPTARRWTAPRAVDSLPAEWTGALGGPGAAIVLGRAAHDSPFRGRIVGCGATGYVGEVSAHAVVWFSDDDGHSYVVSRGAAPFPGLEECFVAELPNGDVLMTARNHLHAAPLSPKGAAKCAGNCQAVAISRDGARTFAPYALAPDLVEPGGGCAAGLLTFGGTVFFSNPASSRGRENMTLKALRRWSSPPTVTEWEDVATIFKGASMYSALVPISQHELGVVYERGRGTLPNGTWEMNITLATVEIHNNSNYDESNRTSYGFIGI